MLEELLLEDLLEEAWGLSVCLVQASEAEALS